MVVSASLPLSSIQKLLEVVKVASRLEKGSGFSASLGLTPSFYKLISTDERLLHFDSSTKTMTTRVTLNDRLLLPQIHHLQGSSSSSSSSPSSSIQQQSQVSLSTLQALIDDVTSWAIVLADPTRGRGGVSVVLRSEWGSHRHRLHHPSSSTLEDMQEETIKEVDIVASVSKIGKSLGFAQAQVRNLKGDVICFGSHIKFLPMGYVWDFLLSSHGWNLAKLYAEHGLEEPPPNSIAPPELSQLFVDTPIEFIADHLANFSPTPAHASLGGALHGGCQAILMELMATRFLQTKLFPEVETATLQSISIDYLSSPSPQQVQLEAKILPYEQQDSQLLIIPVQVVIQSKGRPNSQGLLHFYVTTRTATTKSRL